MLKLTKLIFIFASLLTITSMYLLADEQGDIPQGMVKIEAGKFQHFFKKDEKEIRDVEPFYLDIYAVTNAEFLEFIKKNPQWSRSKISKLFADDHYLQHWDSDFIVKNNTNEIDNSPVTNVSWFAASAYAKYKGKRLPTLAEWESAAAAEIINTTNNKSLNNLELILKWYSRPTPKILPNIGSTFKNTWGVYDMHGLIWEWVADFNSSITVSVTKEAIEKNLFCGAASSEAVNKQDYAAFMRYGYRESLQGAYTVPNLGFRCAKSINK